MQEEPRGSLLSASALSTAWAELQPVSMELSPLLLSPYLLQISTSFFLPSSLSSPWVQALFVREKIDGAEVDPANQIVRKV